MLTSVNRVLLLNMKKIFLSMLGISLLAACDGDGGHYTGYVPVRPISVSDASIVCILPDGRILNRMYVENDYRHVDTVYFFDNSTDPLTISETHQDGKTQVHTDRPIIPSFPKPVPPIPKVIIGQ